jgi:hypothetical protein
MTKNGLTGTVLDLPIDAVGTVIERQ